MTLKALIIDDDPGIVDEVADIVESLGHVSDSASCMESARQRLACGKYDYVLLDLEIPVRDGRTFARVQNGINLLREIRRDPAIQSLPVIVMTGHGNDGPEQAVEVMRAGATDYIAKPFTRGKRTFDEIILEAVASKPADTCSGGFARDAQRPLAKFRGGELVFYPDRVELCGVKVCGRRGIMRTILEALRERLPNGRYKAFSGAALARRAEAVRGQNATAEAVRHFRQKVKKVLAEELDLECGSRDIIENDRKHGYRFSERIVCRDARLHCQSPS